MSNALETGKKLVDLCRKGKNVEAVNTLYAPNVVSVEAMAGSPEMPQRMEGIDKIRGKNEWWMKNHEIHSHEAKGPWANGERFTVYFKYDVTPTSGKFSGKRMQMEETGLYTVRDGKIVQEEFFYDMGQ
ncbi:MAG: nuclear transport factor 2 family protein [Tepidisphaeraceae bacterium]